ncbi:MAG: hypothetical protein J6B87_05590 [Clostridia bacterium]|nr:hypothetical protein [Clostridia bacterium]
MKNKKVEIIGNDVLVSKETGLCYNMTIKKEDNVTSVDVTGVADNTNFTFSFKDRKELLKLTSKVIIDKERLENKVRNAINELQ